MISRLSVFNESCKVVVYCLNNLKNNYFQELLQSPFYISKFENNYKIYKSIAKYTEIDKMKILDHSLLIIH